MKRTLDTPRHSDPVVFRAHPALVKLLKDVAALEGFPNLSAWLRIRLLDYCRVKHKSYYKLYRNHIGREQAIRDDTYEEP